MSAREVAEIVCEGCGSSYRGAFTGYRCPICDRPASTEVPVASGLERATDAVKKRFSTFALALALAGNVAILLTVAILVSRR